MKKNTTKAIDDSHYIPRPEETHKVIDFLFNDIIKSLNLLEKNDENLNVKNFSMNENSENILSIELIEKNIKFYPKIIFILSI